MKPQYIKLAILAVVLALGVAGIAKAPDILSALTTAKAVEASIEDDEPAAQVAKPDVGSGSSSTSGG